jgi:hypothetical protein
MRFSRWDRGLFRVWLVLSAVWSAVVVSLEGADTLLRLALIPATVVLVVGVALKWALNGFRGNE